ncbi:MAG: hypothetical protein HC904_04425 [Blastochloris sp.]|nr:hypothetical protein [Blastochloris sp.]
MTPTPKHSRGSARLHLLTLSTLLAVVGLIWAQQAPLSNPDIAVGPAMSTSGIVPLEDLNSVGANDVDLALKWIVPGSTPPDKGTLTLSVESGADKIEIYDGATKLILPKVWTYGGQASINRSNPIWNLAFWNLSPRFHAKDFKASTAQNSRVHMAGFIPFPILAQAGGSGGWPMTSQAPKILKIRGMKKSQQKDDIEVKLRYEGTPKQNGGFDPYAEEKKIKITVFKVKMGKSAGWSSDNSLPTSQAVQNIFGGTPTINIGQSANNGGTIAYVVPTELKATIEPSGLQIPQADFNIKQKYIAKVTKTYSGNQSPQVDQGVIEDPPFDDQDLDRDGNGAGDIWFVFDAPGFLIKAVVEAQFQQNPNLQSTTLNQTFETKPTYKGKVVGDALNWSTNVSATRNGGNIVFGN